MTMVPLEDMFIDVGARSREEVERMGIRPGLPIAYATDATEFRVLNGTSRYLARAWDDRVGLGVITEVLRLLKNRSHPNNVQVAGDGAGRNRPSRRLGGAGKYPTRHRD